MKKLGRSIAGLLIFLLFTIECSAGSTIDTTQKANFNYLSINNGLSQNSVTCILQDKKGFIWIGTYDGLNRYDGFSITTKRHESANANSLSDNRIKCIYENFNGQILIGTESGTLNVYDPVFDKFSRIYVNSNSTDEKDITSVCSDVEGNIWIGTPSGVLVLDKYYKPIKRLLPQQTINTIIRDHHNNMWIATTSGLYFNKTGNSFLSLTPLKEVGTKSVNVIYQDKEKQIWIGEDHQLSKLTIEKNVYPSYTTYKPFPAEVKSPITAIQQDLNGDLWVGNRLEGLFQLHLDQYSTPTLKRWYATDKPFCNISENSISVLMVDRSNVLWAGTFQQGVNFTNLSIQKFYTFYPLLSGQIRELGYKGKLVTAVCEYDNRLWIGTATEGLFCYDFKNKVLSNYKDILGERWISSLFVSKDNNLWIGTSLGLYKVSSATQKPESVVDKLNIHSIAQDRYANIWMTTWDGIYIYNPSTKKINTINTKNGLSSKYTFLVYADPVFSTMWVTTIGNGLNKITYDSSGKKTIISYRHREKQTGSLTSNYIWSIYRDNSNIMWLGTDGGLDKVVLDKAGNLSRTTHISHNQLEDRKILGILPDEDNNLWLSNSQGLFKYNTTNGKVQQYSHKDGLQSNTLTEAVYKNKNGIMYVGGINGLNFFDPREIKDNPFPTQLALTELKIFSQSIQAGQKINGHLILEKDINNTEKITLSYKENNFLLNFASLHFAAPENNRFKYKLEGYDKDWIITNAAQRFAAYSNLPAGNYHFLITASNNDGRWNEEYKKITIIIQPAPWATWWAKTLYLIIITVIVYAVIRYFRTKRILKEQVYKEKLEKEKVTELNEIKLDFFTNITHELRTPLNLILGPTRELLDKVSSTDDYSKLRLNIIYKNSQRLFTLINQVLDLRKISSDSNRLFITRDDLVKTIAEVKQSFNWIAEQKHIQYDFTFDHMALQAWYDKDKVEKIAFNLLSNAFKHTPENGSISIELVTESVDTAKPVVHIIFRDSGCGIDPSEIDRVFDLFYQSKKQTNLGSGIGLTLVKKLTELHHGHMTVASLPKEGTIFKISIPVGINSYDSEDIFETEVADTKFQIPYTSSNKFIPTTKKEKRPSILIIEDNEDQTAYVKEHLKDSFHVYEAADGNEGFAYALKHVPDLIITDLMMPELDGIEVCRRLKANTKTNHIPVLIHSVKSTGESVKRALEAGATDFIPKPCDYRLLRLKINNILQSNQHLLVKQYKENITTLPEVTVPDQDAALLKKVIEIIEKNITEPSFSVEMLSREVAMSRMHLHRRLNDIIGKTASELIREVKMKRAAQLLTKGGMRVTEVMYEVGISNYNLFNKYFKDSYGVTPKDYKKVE